jgi:hypothetical protein
MDDSHGKAISTVTAVFLAISAVSVCLRCFVRLHLVRAFGWDDSSMLLAMVCLTEIGTAAKWWLMVPDDRPLISPSLFVALLGVDTEWAGS